MGDPTHQQLEQERQSRVRDRAVGVFKERHYLFVPHHRRVQLWQDVVQYGRMYQGPQACEFLSCLAYICINLIILKIAEVVTEDGSAVKFSNEKSLGIEKYSIE